MKTLRRFWKALDEVPETATDRLEWKERLGDDWAHAESFLRSTGRQVTAVACPSPGGDGCPRAVVRGVGGSIRAVCRSRPKVCDPLDLTASDIAVLTLDRARLLKELSRVLVAEPPSRPTSHGLVMMVGRHSVVAGLSCPVLLALPGPRSQMTADDLREAGLEPNASVVLTPNPASLPAPLRGQLTAAGHIVVGLSEVTTLDAQNRLALLQTPEALLAPARDTLLARLKPASTAPRMALPPSTVWEQITFTLTSTSTLTCSTPGWSRQLDPSDFGMRSAKNKNPTLAWIMLVSLAISGGSMSVKRPGERAKFQKQKEALSKNLRETLGIDSDPVPWDQVQKAYTARFILKDNLTLAERQAFLRR